MNKIRVWIMFSTCTMFKVYASGILFDTEDFWIQTAFLHILILSLSNSELG